MKLSSLFARAIIASASLLARDVARAQTPYLVSHTTGSWAEITSGGTVHAPMQYGGLAAWDEGYVEITLPFTFTWYGQAYSTLYGYTNGFVGFNPPPPNTSFLNPPFNVPAPGNIIHNFIGVMWADLDGGVAPEIRSIVNGPTGSRIFTVQFRGLQAFANPLSSVNFQVRMHEASNTIELVFGPNNGIGQVGTTAMENVNGSEGLNLMAAAADCTGTCVCSPAACGSLNWQPTGRTISITLPTGPELTGEIFGPPGAFPGTNFDATVRIRNLGLSATGAFRYQIRLSQTNTSTQGSTLLETVDVPAGIAASTTMESIRTLTMPANAGIADYYLALIIDLDDDVMEAIETNNLLFSPNWVSTAPDLLGTLTAPATGGPGEPINVSLTMRSAGAPVTDPITVAFILSEDDIPDPSDLPMGTAVVTMLDGFEATDSIELTVPANAPASPPNYQILALIDDPDAVQETNEFNNIAPSDLVTLSGPDLQATTIDAGPFAFLGLTYPVIGTITNAGGATARDFTACVAISTNALISVISDPILIETAPMTLFPGEVARLNLQPVVPVTTATGAWYVAVIADCADAIVEQLETNNVKRRIDTITIRTPAADFSPLEIATASSAAAGETIPVSARIGNIGNISGTAFVRFVVSTNVGATTDDPLIYETPMAVTIDAGMETSVTAWAALPGDLQSGNYWIGAIVDPLNTLEEVYEDNNAVAFGPVAVSGANISIITPNPPNAVIGVPYVRRFSAVGGTGMYTWEISFASGAPPAGLTFDPATAELRGTPETSAEGRHEITVRVRSGNVSAVRTYNLLITQPTIPLSVVSSRLPPALLLEPYQVQLIAVGGTPPYRWQLESAGVPSGLTLADDGELGGEPQGEPNGYTFTVSVTDLAGITATGVVSIDVVATDISVSITNADIPSAVVGQYYETFFQVSGGTPDYHWRLDVDVPIPGLSFDAGDVSLTGTPTVAGEYPIIVEVRDANGLIDRNAYVLDVLAPGDLVITTGSSQESQLPHGIVGNNYVDRDGNAVRLRAVQRSGGDAQSLTWTIADGTLAPGLSLDATSGVISGTPSAEGKYPFRVLVTNPAGDFAFSALVIEVDPQTMITEGGGDGCSCSAKPSRANAAWALLLVLGLFALRRRRAVLGVAVLAFFPATLEAQIIPYTVTTTTIQYEQLQNATEIMPVLGDGNTVELVLPFNYYLFGEPANRVFVNANGLISPSNIGFGHHFPPFANPDPFGLVRGFIAGLWDDWCSSGVNCSFPYLSGIGVFYKIDAFAGTASFEWRHVKHFSDNILASDINFKITIYEGLSSRIDFDYGVMSQGSTTFFASRIGLENVDGTEGMWIGPCAGSPCDFTDLNALENQRIMLIADAGEDITVDSVGVPAVGYPGLPLPISARLSSRHGQPLGPTRVAAYVVAPSATSTIGGTLVYAGDPLTLAPFDTQLLQISAEIPIDLPVGNYRIALLADYLGQLAETDEENNFTVSIATVRIADRAPDFRISRVLPLSSSLAPGAPLSIVFNAENFGNEPGVLRMQAYLSSNEAITTSDVVFGTAVQFDTVAREAVTGTISATLPSTLVTGTYYVGLIADAELTVAELSENNNVGRSAQPIIVSANNVQILSTELPPATLGVAYSTNVNAAGGNGRFTYRLAGGALPRGMSFDVTEAEVFGIPLETGAFPLEIEARSGTLTDRESLTLNVLDPTLPLTIVTRDLPEAILGQDYAESIRVVGGVAPYAWRITSGGLPRGVLLGTDGVLFGQPSMVGLVPFSVEIRDNASSTSTASFVFETRSPGNLTIVSAILADGVVGEEYYQALQAIGGSAMVAWQAVTEPPPGLIVDEEGLVRGLPEHAGDYRFRVRAVDRITGVEDTNFLLVNISAEGRFGIETTSLPDGEPGQQYRAILKGQGGKKPYDWTVVAGEGSLPPAFDARKSLGASEGETPDDLIISGTFPAEKEGVWTFTLRLADQEGRVDEHPFALVSRTTAPMIDPMTIDDSGCGCNSAREPTSRFDSALIFAALAALACFRKRRLP